MTVAVDPPLGPFHIVNDDHGQIRHFQGNGQLRQQSGKWAPFHGNRCETTAESCRGSCRRRRRRRRRTLGLTKDTSTLIPLSGKKSKLFFCVLFSRRREGMNPTADLRSVCTRTCILQIPAKYEHVVPIKSYNDETDGDVDIVAAV